MAELQMIDMCSTYIKNMKRQCTAIILGHAGVNFVPMHPNVQPEIVRYPELQDEWRAVAPLYFEAKMRSKGQMNALTTSTANVMTSASTSVAPLAASDATATSPADSATSSKPAASLTKSTKAQIAATNIRIAPNAGDLGKYHADTRTRKKPATLDPNLKHANRPGGPAPTCNRPNAVTDADRKLSKEKAPPKGFHFDPSDLNLHMDEDPNLCRGIFENETRCPFARDPRRCQYRHYVQQETLDFVVTKRGVNIELIEWILANYTKNTPASVRRIHAQEARTTLHVPRGPSAFGLTPSGLEAIETVAQREERAYPATSANASAADAAAHPAADPTRDSGLPVCPRVPIVSGEDSERWTQQVQQDDRSGSPKSDRSNLEE